jgi:glutathione S-transferase
MAAWKISGNGENVSKFASRGGPDGAKNNRKRFGAELADPYAKPDDKILPTVDAALRVVCLAMLDENDSLDPFAGLLKSTVPEKDIVGVTNSFSYLRDRVGVPRDLPLAAARYLRAYLNWGIEVLSK